MSGFYEMSGPKEVDAKSAHLDVSWDIIAKRVVKSP